MTKIRVLLIDDHRLLREGLRGLLGCYDDLVLVGEAANGAAALEQVQALKPQVVIMDIAMPVMDDLRFTRCLGETFPESRLVVLIQEEDSKEILPLMRAGVSGFVLKQNLGSDLITAIRAVARSETFLSSSMRSVLMETNE
jgi:DNA-binding NarL/FixJ family response regulator